ncbi:hypothetical protein VIBC2010_00994 [Vibrio caribbeanicus ATCC BAA-2122]|uniref:Uncharacterized protein n=1 Tax=Vibrio caribbeanicus ATCC BAA-2122 TaxID=796620 RepID=E3BGM0_9VIBR|nr:hypothetical protein VIBC2010_00994 [Vibrio caribbeanicus ATCC BAA-2122]
MKSALWHAPKGREKSCSIKVEGQHCYDFKQENDIFESLQFRHLAPTNSNLLPHLIKTNYQHQL